MAAVMLPAKTFFFQVLHKNLFSLPQITMKYVLLTYKISLQSTNSNTVSYPIAVTIYCSLEKKVWLFCFPSYMKFSSEFSFQFLDCFYTTFTFFFTGSVSTNKTQIMVIVERAAHFQKHFKGVERMPTFSIN